MLNVVSPLTPEQVLKIALWCLLLMDTSGLRVTLMAEYEAAAEAKDTTTKNKATKKDSDSGYGREQLQQATQGNARRTER